jgi:hypothetical protein
MSRSTDHLYVVSGEEEYDQAEKSAPGESTDERADGDERARHLAVSTAEPD